ncbi:DUF2141 domain-containing protein [Psychroserpens sp. SPM9]|uniref:DUF2141 domain-containing protein n=1 Tax=Psychroserpens sp. SPM9 TaxID=2975598 RepID=UPI0021A5B3C8|nr:DUF2141 domain-containing protein [Psychroserpens sp. SPM9]MDG5492957.1 DUF2141 domain-containing protein [Psychroserpens sp. SPM9]
MTTKTHTLLLTIVLTLVTALGFSQDTKGQTVTITIENAKNDDGKLLVALHTKDTFMKGPGVKNAESKIKDGKAVITFEDVTAGEYAVMVLHDANENNKMDFEESGMPKESYGTSNNTRSFGPPNYDDAKFKVDKDIALSIRF